MWNLLKSKCMLICQRKAVFWLNGCNLCMASRLQKVYKSYKHMLTSLPKNLCYAFQLMLTRIRDLGKPRISVDVKSIIRRSIRPKIRIHSVDDIQLR
jgi:hypothetical protein